MEIQPGKKYAVQRDEEVIAVEVTSPSPFGGWLGIDLTAGQAVWIMEEDWIVHELVETPGPDGKMFLAKPGSKIFALPEPDKCPGCGGPDDHYPDCLPASEGGTMPDVVRYDSQREQFPL